MIIQSSSKLTVKLILGLILRYAHCAQVALQIHFNYNLITYNFYIGKSQVICQEIC